jgi:hypothetical protein
MKRKNKFALLLLLSIGAAVAQDMPDSKLTPGLVDPALTAQVLCAPGFSTSTIRNVTESTKKQVYARYGIQPKQGYCSGPQFCEVDHLISLEIGGKNDIQNLWPQPYDGTWSAYMKDQLENKLHKMVCSGQLPLAQAQKEIAADWRVAYQKYMK